MNSAVECPNGHGPTESISCAIVDEAVDNVRHAIDKYLHDPRGFFAADVRKEATSNNETAKRKINLLSSVGKKDTNEAAARYEEQRANYWKAMEAIEARIRAQEEENNAENNAKGKDDSAKDACNKEEGDEQATSGKDAEKTAEPLVIRDARKAIANHIRLCKKEIREKDPFSESWPPTGIEIIDGDYKKARAIAKKAIEAATNNKTDEAEKVDKEQAEKLLENLREIWLDARGHFDDITDYFLDPELEDERGENVIWF
ncbi:hypothetical protein F5B21DRAFT_527898 [Xylaria acuta]|nr:hypothetical protein F5B21DRAFT_527898 [Xylaria acuta]